MFKLFKGKKNNQWYWNLTAKNGKVICQSEGYKDMKTALKGMKSVIINASSVKSFQLVKGKEKDNYIVKG